LRYNTSDCFETFPFPRPLLPTLEAIGERLYTTRAAYMVAHHAGLTTTYNRLKDPENHDPEIVALRHLHEEMDRAVLAAYGWGDVAVPPYGTPVTPGEKACPGASPPPTAPRSTPRSSSAAPRSPPARSST
jgi:hypothetical protein